MPKVTQGPWRVLDDLIEQPSWGGRFIIDLKSLSDDPAWTGKKVGQSYELSKQSVATDPASGKNIALKSLIESAPKEVLGDSVIAKFGTDLSLLIKLTQAKGNSFQIHLPEGEKLNHWLPKPEAWFYLAPGLFTFGLKEGVALEDYKTALRKIDTLMKKLSVSVKSGAIDIETARAEAKAEIAKIDPYQYVNIVEADEDDVIDLTPGGIHHSWEEDDSKFPQGNLVYEVQVDVADEYCSMRGFDKGKLLADGGLRATHVEDYLTTIERYSEGKKLSDLIGKPKLLTEKEGAKEEAIFRTPYFELDRVTLKAGSVWNEPAETGFHHLFVQKGSAKVGETILAQGQSFIVPAVTGVYKIESAEGVTILKTSLPLE